MKTQGLGKKDKLLKSTEFKAAISKGSSAKTEHFTVVMSSNNLRHCRLGITAGRSVGSAVQRNRVKRLLREFFRLHKSQLPPSSDILFIAKRGSETLSYDELREELKGVLLMPMSPQNGT